MTIALDAGNGSLKVALVEGDRVGPVHAFPAARLDAAVLAEHLAGLQELGGDQQAPIALVSVVPAASVVVRQATSRIGARLLVADVTTIPMTARVAEPDRVGADRLLGAWGAREIHGAPVIVVDLGTATTVDVVDTDGAFVGGAILPGMELALAALARGTALLPEVDLAPPRSALARDTVESLRSGGVLGHVGAIREVVARIVHELLPGGPRPPVVATGGVTRHGWAADLLTRAAGADLPPVADAVDPDLLLRSLGRLADQRMTVRP